MKDGHPHVQQIESTSKEKKRSKIGEAAKLPKPKGQYHLTISTTNNANTCLSPRETLKTSELINY